LADKSCAEGYKCAQANAAAALCFYGAMKRSRQLRRPRLFEGVVMDEVFDERLGLGSSRLVGRDSCDIERFVLALSDRLVSRGTDYELVSLNRSGYYLPVSRFNKLELFLLVVSIVLMGGVLAVLAHDLIFR
jgi:hypothetical protein